MFEVILKGKWFVVSDFSYMMNHIAWIIFLVAFSCCILIILCNLLKKLLSRFMRIKQAYVEIIYIPKSILERDVVGVRFIKPRKIIRKGFI